MNPQLSGDTIKSGGNSVRVLCVLDGSRIFDEKGYFAPPPEAGDLFLVLHSFLLDPTGPDDFQAEMAFVLAKDGIRLVYFPTLNYVEFSEELCPRTLRPSDGDESAS